MHFYMNSPLQGAWHKPFLRSVLNEGVKSKKIFVTLHHTKNS